MLEFTRNEPVDAEVLAGLFNRCGWEERAGGVKLEWALAASAEWVVCKLDGELIGFGRSCRLGPVKRVMFDVLVDPRFDHPVLRRQIMRLLVQNVGGLEEVSVFRGRGSRWRERLAGSLGDGASEPGASEEPRPSEGPGAEKTTGQSYTGGGPFLKIRAVPPGAYLGANVRIEEDR
jgi:hypothetical protein